MNEFSRQAWVFTRVTVVFLVLCLSIVAGSLNLRLSAVGAATTISGCGSATPGSTTLTPTIDDVVRTVIVHIPKRSNDATPLALILNLHGSGSTALEQEGFTGMDKTANQDNFIVAYPQALIPDGTGFDWNIPGVPLIGGRKVPANSANDVKFLTKLVHVLESKYCINSSMVYATGFSGGARESSQLACDDSNLFAAVAPVSGLRRPQPCPTLRSVPILSFHGSVDPVDPFAGHGQAYWTYSVSTAEKDWAQQDKCSLKSTVTSTSTSTFTEYANCSNGAAVELYEIIGEGHEWPGGPTLPSLYTSVLGPQSNALDANNVMWAFFQAHPLKTGS
jgi:polyhydroxybutyrate depolymerase